MEQFQTQGGIEPPLSGLKGAEVESNRFQITPGDGPGQGPDGPHPLQVLQPSPGQGQDGGQREREAEGRAKRGLPQPWEAGTAASAGRGSDVPSQ